MNKAEDLIKIEQMVEDTSCGGESILHKALKKWVCIEMYEQGVPVDAFEFEKKIKYRDSVGRLTRHTIIDVFINQNGGLAFYCQCKNDYPWLYKFLEHIPALKENSAHQYVVCPENLEALYPMRWQQYISELSRKSVNFWSAPFHIKMDSKEVVQINMTYSALHKLVRIKNKFNYKKPLVDFIDRDLERIIKEKRGFP